MAKEGTRSSSDGGRYANCARWRTGGSWPFRTRRKLLCSSLLCTGLKPCKRASQEAMVPDGSLDRSGESGEAGRR